MIFKKAEFIFAKPVFIKNKSLVKNTTMLMTTKLSRDAGAIMRMAGHCSYQVYINGIFVHFGPARAGKYHYRVDELPIGKYLVNESNLISVLVSSYNCRSFYQMDGEGFFCCEFHNSDNVYAPTGSDSWTAYLYDEKYVKVARQCFQRPFSEGYDMTKHPGYELTGEGRAPIEVSEVSEKIFIERELSLPEYPYEPYGVIYDHGDVTVRETKNHFSSRELNAVKNPNIDGYPFEELELIPVYKAENCVLTSKGDPNADLPMTLDGGSYVGVKFNGERTGFITLKVDCLEDTELIITWSETLENDGSVNFRRLGSSVLYYQLKGGISYTLISAEPYSLHYSNVITTKGSVNFRSFGVIRADFNESEINVTLNKKADDQIGRIYNAAIETFRQNTFDIFMDCPSRERAGWLCDSFFTSRVEKLLTNKSTVEKCFLSNFAMDKEPRFLPDGMLPMCYPADHPDGAFIPNWAMWYVIELNEYLSRTEDREFIDDMKDRLYKLLKYFRRFENSDGLLEKLESWVFVEWSMSNNLVQDINYPTNMLYSMFKRVLGNLYDDPVLLSEADELRKTIREKSLIGNFFCDNAVYNENGVAVLSGECTESCQYYAFFCGIATLEEDKALWDILLNDFGPDRKINNKWPKIHFANAFIGNYLRLDLLMREGEKARLEDNIRGYFDYMAIRTGTLWENDSPHASCNHGFASHVLVWLDYLGYIDR